MSPFKKLGKIFSSMPKREKTLVVVLTIILAASVSQLIFSHLRFPLRQQKNVFAEGMIGRIQYINPLFVDFNDSDRDISQLVFSGLIKYDPVQKNFFPDLAQTWDRSRDGMTYNFVLRENALWHDETPVTPEDIIFTFKDVIQDPGFKNPIIKNAFEGVKVNKTGTSTISFILPKPNSYFISNLTVGILPKHILEKTAIADLEKSPFNQKPIGTGPYQLTSLKLDSSGDRVDLTSFAKYYGEKPNISHLRFYTFPDEKTLLSNTGAVHSLSKLNNQSAAFVEKDSRFNIYNYTLNQFTAIYFNTSNPLLKNKKIRQALALALNKNELLAQGESRIDALDLENHAEDPSFASNMGEAAKIMDGFGYHTGTEGFRINSKGEKLSLKLLVFAKNPKEIAEKIRSKWQTLGIQIPIESAGSDTFAKYVSERRYDILLIRQNLGYNRDVYPLFHSSQIGENGQNFSNFKSFRTDGLTEAIRKEKDPSDKEKLLKELTKVISEEIPVIFISTPVYSYAIDKRMQAFHDAHLDFHSDRLKILPYLSFPNL